MFTLLSALLALLGEALLAPPEARYLGAGACGACHAPQLASQSESGHAGALQRAADHRRAAALESASPLRGTDGLLFALALAPPAKLRVSDGKASAEAPIDWAFGSGTHAVTFAGQIDEETYVEHAVTWYARSGALDRTPGHRPAPRGAVEAALGVRYRTFAPEPSILRCFRCHSTGPLALGERLQIQPAEPGVRCEACHGPGSLHAAAAARGEMDAARRAIRNPSRLSAEEQNRFCGTCHRMPAPAGAPTNWNDPWNARHQPLYLAESACFRKSRGALSCLTCHEPHRALVRNAAAYNARCATCHAPARHPALPGFARADNCVNCHMPAIEPRPDLQFTNHWIGVYREGSPLRPVAR